MKYVRATEQNGDFGNRAGSVKCKRLNTAMHKRGTNGSTIGRNFFMTEKNRFLNSLYCLH